VNNIGDTKIEGLAALRDKSQRVTWLMAVGYPAYRQQEPYPGLSTEQENLWADDKGKCQKSEWTRQKYQCCIPQGQMERSSDDSPGNGEVAKVST